ncbi:hypothetical protein V5799_022909 [Amblyomma americanum]|uniref:Uncharacterized protein n=1 Tax=Amblyomma americanum TaxID=6943 RepID=A0AAQ4FJ64_AMBAM
MVADVLRMTVLNTHIPVNCSPVVESPKGTGGGPVRRFSPDTAHPVQFTQYLNKALRAARSSPSQRHSAYLATFNTGVSPLVSYQLVNSHEIPAEFAPNNVIYNPITGELRFINRGLTDREKRTIAQIKRARMEAGDLGTALPDRAYYQRMVENGICNVDASGSRLSAAADSCFSETTMDVPGYFQTHSLFRGVPSKYVLPTRGRSIGVSDFETCSRVKPPAGVVIGLDSTLSPINIVARQMATGNTVTRYVSNGVYTRTCEPGSTDPNCLNTTAATAGGTAIAPNVADSVAAIVRACIRESERIGGGSLASTAFGVGKNNETELAIHDIIRSSSTPSALIGQTMQHLRSLPDTPVNTRAARYFMAILVNIG